MKLRNKEEIIKLVNENKIVIMPTDTVYGLMAKLSQENEYALNEFKKSDRNKKISIIFDSVDTLLKNIDDMPENRINMIKDKLPGKYTFIVNLKEEFTKSLGFNRKDFGVRVTSNEDLQNVLKVTGPVLATSCNYSKEDICVSLEDIKKIFEKWIYRCKRS